MGTKGVNLGIRKTQSESTNWDRISGVVLIELTVVMNKNGTYGWSDTIICRESLRAIKGP